MQVQILSGITVDASAQFRTKLPVNYVPVPKDNGIAKGFFAPPSGIVKNGSGPGTGRGGINWNGTLYRVMGTKLVSVDKNGVCTVLGDVGGSGQVTLDYSFDSLGIVSNKKLFYWSGSELTQVTDVDLGVVIDAAFMSGYWMTTDGTYLIVTDLSDPTSVTTTRYGSSEADPDPIMAVDELRNEAVAFNRYTIEFFQQLLNAGTGFPYQRIDGALVKKGIVGTHCYAELLGSFAFLGSGRNEPPGVHLVTSGDSIKLSTDEVDKQLKAYSEADLSKCLVEAQIDDAHEYLHVHLPDKTLTYDASASKSLGEPIWHIRQSGITPGKYRARNLVWAYDAWRCEDPASSDLGVLVDAVSSHYGIHNSWEFGVPIIYNAGNDAIIHEMELVCLPGRVSVGADPVIWTSYSKDGEKWSLERTARTGKQGDTTKRIAWRGQGTIGQYRMQKFRGTTESHMSIARLEIQPEPLFTRPMNG